MSIRAPILIDTNVLVLLIVGTFAPALIEMHKRCSSFTQDDYRMLLRTIGSDPTFVVLPNIMTEASNLLRQGIADPYRAQLASLLGRFAEKQREVYVESRSAARHPLHARLGITDCATLSMAEDVHLLTVDFDLYMAFLAVGRPVTNFRHVIDGRVRP